MEAAYIKTAIGPILTEALTSLLAHVPNPGPQGSPLSTTIDPISYIGEYLLHHSKVEKEKLALQAQQESIEAVKKKWSEAETRLKAQRDILGTGLAARLSNIRNKEAESTGPEDANRGE